jgi:hypothetical protein
LLAPFAPYDVTYMALMAALAFATVVWLALRRLLIAAAALALYLMVGGKATALARFDLVPGVLVLATLVLAERRRFAPAYLTLALATVLKVYPAYLLPVLAIHQWRQTGRFPGRDLALFWLAVAGGLLPGALLDFATFRQPLSYNAARPPQIESVPGSLLWLAGRFGGVVPVRLSYHSLNVTGPQAGLAAWTATLLLLAGLSVACRRAWQGRDCLGRSFIVVLLVTLAGSKLLSPQYLLWLFPVVAYVEGFRLRWSVLGALTTAIYPYAYGFSFSLVRLPEKPIFMGSILSRNALLVALAVVYLTARSCRREV